MGSYNTGHYRPSVGKQWAQQRSVKRSWHKVTEVWREDSQWKHLEDGWQNWGLRGEGSSRAWGSAGVTDRWRESTYGDRGLGEEHALQDRQWLASDRGFYMGLTISIPLCIRHIEECVMCYDHQYTTMYSPYWGMCYVLVIKIQFEEFLEAKFGMHHQAQLYKVK